MLYILTTCNFTRFAVEAMHGFFSKTNTQNKNMYVIDSRYFKTISEINNFVRNISRVEPMPIIIIIIGSRFRYIAEEKYNCGIHLKAPLKLWYQIMQKALNEELDIRHTIRCLNYYCYPDRLSSREAEIFNYIRHNNSIEVIAQKMNVKEKSVYQYIFRLQRYYKQPSLAYLYHFIQGKL